MRRSLPASSSFLSGTQILGLLAGALVAGGVRFQMLLCRQMTGSFGSTAAVKEH